MTSIKIVLPLPDKRLSPNARLHYMAKANAVAKARADSYFATRAAMAGRANSEPRFHTATVQATFYRKTNRKVDPDNALSSLKAFFDGLKDAGLIADDSGLTHLPVKVAIDRDDPRLELVVTP